MCQSIRVKSQHLISYTLLLNLTLTHIKYFRCLTFWIVTVDLQIYFPNYVSVVLSIMLSFTDFINNPIIYSWLYPSPGFIIVSIWKMKKRKYNQDLGVNYLVQGHLIFSEIDSIFKPKLFWVKVYFFILNDWRSFYCQIWSQ